MESAIERDDLGYPHFRKLDILPRKLAFCKKDDEDLLVKRWAWDSWVFHGLLGSVEIVVLRPLGSGGSSSKRCWYDIIFPAIIH